MGQGAGAAGGTPMPTNGLSNSSFGMNNAFNSYQGANDYNMDLNSVNSFGGKDVNIDTAFADQKGTGFDWKNAFQKGLMGIADNLIQDLSPKANPQLPTQQGGFQQTPDAKGQSFSNADLYNKLMQQQFMNWQNQQTNRFKQGVAYGK